MRSLIDFKRRIAKINKTLRTVDFKSKEWKDAYLERRSIEKRIGKQ